MRVHNQILTRSRLPITLAVAFGVQFCRGMVHACQTVPELVHRDIKPANTLVAPNFLLKITDWGLAKTVQETSGRSLGTLPYTAPERFTGSEPEDTRSDVYSFGVMLYEMLACCLPLATARRDPAAWAQCHLSETPERPSHYRRGIPDALDALVLRCLEKEPHRRPAAFAEIEAELDSLHERLTGNRIVVNTWGGSQYQYLCNEAVSWVAQDRFSEAQAVCRQAIELKPEAFQAWLNLGVALYESGDYQDALEACDQALAREQEDPLTWNNHGNVLHALGRVHEALASYSRAVALDPQYDRAWSNKGWTLLDSCRRFDDALECFDRAVQVNPNFADAWNNRGITLWRLGRNDDALASVGEALNLDPTHIKALVNQAAYLVHSGRFEEAEESCNRALQIDAGCYPAITNLAVVLFNTGRIEEAWERCDQAIHACTEGVPHEALALKSELLVDQGRLDEALECLRQADAASPNNPGYVSSIAEVQVRRGDLRDARKTFERVVGLDACGSDTLYNFGALLVQLGEHRLAAQQYRAAIEKRPEFPEAYNNLGATLFGLEDYAAAENAFRRCIELDPTSAKAHKGLGACLSRRKRDAEALDMYRRALKLRPDYADAWFDGGNVLLRQGKVDDAEEYYRTAVSHDANHFQAISNLAVIAQQKGDAARAVQLYDRVLEIQPGFGPAVSNRKLALASLDEPSKEPSRIDPKTIVAIVMLVPAGEGVAQAVHGRLAVAVYREINAELAGRLEEERLWENIRIGHAESPLNPEGGMIRFAYSVASRERQRGHTVLIQGGLETSPDAQRSGLPSELWFLTVAKAEGEPGVGFVTGGPLAPT